MWSLYIREYDARVKGSNPLYNYRHMESSQKQGWTDKNRGS